MTKGELMDYWWRVCSGLAISKFIWIYKRYWIIQYS